MAILDFLSGLFKKGPEMNDATKMAILAGRNPGLGNFIQQYNLSQQEAADREKMAGLAGFIYGNPAQGGQPASGIYDTTMPISDRNNQIAQRMLSTGLQGYLDQWALLNRDMQKLSMGGTKGQVDPNIYRIWQKTLGPNSDASPEAFGRWYAQNKPKGVSVEINQGKKMVPLSEIPNLVDVSGNNPAPGVSFGDLGGQYTYRPPSAVDRAGRQAGLEVALSRIPELRKQIFSGPNGSVDRDTLFQLGILEATKGIPGVEKATSWWASPRAKTIQNSMDQGIQSISRTETGAAMAAGEIENISRRFMPSPTDDDALIKAKLDSYEQFLSTASNLLQPNKVGVSTLSPSIANRLIKAAAEEQLSNIPKFGGSEAPERRMLDGYPILIDEE